MKKRELEAVMPKAEPDNGQTPRTDLVWSRFPCEKATDHRYIESRKLELELAAARAELVAANERAVIAKTNCYLAAEHGRENGSKCNALIEAERLAEENAREADVKCEIAVSAVLHDRVAVPVVLLRQLRDADRKHLIRLPTYIKSIIMSLVDYLAKVENTAARAATPEAK